MVGLLIHAHNPGVATRGGELDLYPNLTLTSLVLQAHLNQDVGWARRLGSLTGPIDLSSHRGVLAIVCTTNPKDIITPVTLVSLSRCHYSTSMPQTR